MSKVASFRNEQQLDRIAKGAGRRFTVARLVQEVGRQHVSEMQAFHASFSSMLYTHDPRHNMRCRNAGAGPLAAFFTVEVTNGINCVASCAHQPRQRCCAECPRVRPPPPPLPAARWTWPAQ